MRGRAQAEIVMVRQTSEIMRPRQNRASAKNNHVVAAILGGATEEVTAAMVKAEEILREVADMALVGHREVADMEEAVSQKVSSLILG